MSWFCKLCSHLKLIYNLKIYYNYYQLNETYNEILLDKVLNNVTECGAVMIKFCQWITPKLELIYSEDIDIINDKKPKWLLKMEQYYENCANHSLEYTKQEYYRVFNEDPEEIYEFNEIIGSGSIGQVYLVKNKETNQEEVMKILHPNVKDQINFFDKFVRFLLYFPCINNKVKTTFPFDIFEFIRQFRLQSNFINEANHILYFYEEYENNDFIIIPKLKRISPSILIMSYEPGLPFEDTKLNDYQNDKIVNLYHLFIRNNQMIKNYNHGDLHPGNWKVRIDNENNNHKLVIYDFGYCWKQNQSQFEEMGDLMTETFESSNRQTNDVSLNNLSRIMYYAILYNGEDKETEYKNRIKTFINKRLIDLEPWKLSPIVLLKATIDFCKENNLFLDTTLLQGFIVIIQAQKLFEKYGLMASDKNLISDYKVFRERYLNILTICKTYNIFEGYLGYIEDKLNKKQVKVDNIFDTIDIDIDNDLLKTLALKNK
tara:strand:+ start:857 stop:2317 length:1461 start_codon:yes stop_codon:yes gene_type:complete